VPKTNLNHSVFPMEHQLLMDRHRAMTYTVHHGILLVKIHKNALTSPQYFPSCPKWIWGLLCERKRYGNAETKEQRDRKDLQQETKKWKVGT